MKWHLKFILSPICDIGLSVPMKNMGNSREALDLFSGNLLDLELEPIQ